MARQSRPPRHGPGVLLTRPAAQGERFAAALRDRFGAGLRIVVSPLLSPVFIDPTLPDGPFASVVFTSETGVAAAGRAMPWRGDAWCVGDRTARAAVEAGFRARSVAGDAGVLVGAIIAAGDPGPLLHLRGRDSRGDIAARLTAAGIPTRDAVVYDQRPQALSRDALRLLTGPDPVLAPVFSPRTARLLVAERDRRGLTAPLHLVAFSPAVGAAFAPRPGDRLTTATRPDAEAMLDAVAAALGMG